MAKSKRPALTQDDRDNLRRLITGPWPNLQPGNYTDGARVSICREALGNALRYIEHLEKEVASYERTMENINQALNEGDGTYRP